MSFSSTNLDKNNTDCAICYKDIDISKGNIAILSCKHRFCLDCLCYHYIRNNSCPLCRKEFAISTDEITKNIQNDDSNSETDPEDSEVFLALNGLSTSIFNLDNILPSILNYSNNSNESITENREDSEINQGISEINQETNEGYNIETFGTRL